MKRPAERSAGHAVTGFKLWGKVVFAASAEAQTEIAGTNKIFFPAIVHCLGRIATGEKHGAFFRTQGAKNPGQQLGVSQIFLEDGLATLLGDAEQTAVCTVQPGESSQIFYAGLRHCIVGEHCLAEQAVLLRANA